MTAETLPMFPLGSVVVPGMLVPLHVFEPRYRALVQAVLGGDGRFGMVLIERGSEVGGGDERTDVGVVVRVLQAEEAPDGRWGIVAIGEHRLRVTRWLPDDPYPRAEIEPWPDAAQPVAQDRVEAVAAEVRRAVALRLELGEHAGPLELELPPDASMATHLLCAASPLGPADRQRLLACAGPAERLALLDELIAEEIELSSFRLGGAR